MRKKYNIFVLNYTIDLITITNMYLFLSVDFLGFSSYIMTECLNNNISVSTGHLYLSLDLTE
jgi:hypothetical protein